MARNIQESVILQFRYSRKSPKYLPKYILALILLFSSLYIFLFGVPLQLNPLREIGFQFFGLQFNALTTPALFLASLGLVYIFSLEVGRLKINYLITNSSVMQIKGILRKSHLSLNLPRVNNIGVDQNIAHRILSTGNLRVETDTSALFLGNIKNPHEIKRTILDTINRKFKPAGDKLEKFRVPTRTGGNL